MATIDSHEQDRFLVRLQESFALTPQDARTIMDGFHQEMGNGLSGKSSSLRMIPSFATRPKGTEKGKFLALDLGGTHMRVLMVGLDGNRNAKIDSVSKFVIPADRMQGSGLELFDFIAGCIQSFFQNHQISARETYDLAFTFSFPVEQTAVASGKLIEWTKGFHATGCGGQRRGGPFVRSDGSQAHGSISVCPALLNDTVGTLVAGAYSDPSCHMGVILGTGTNACYPEKIGNIKTCPGYDTWEEMIINMEWGGFDRLQTNLYDHQLDMASLNPGRQRLEKMVSGMYLGEIVRRIVVDMVAKTLLFTETLPPVFHTEHTLTSEHLSKIAGKSKSLTGDLFPDASEPDIKILERICHMVVSRSAKIAAAAIAAVLTWMDAHLDSHHTVAMDGALFEKYPGYADCMTGLFRDLFPDRSERIHLELVKDGSGIGAAIVGAVAALPRSGS